MNKRLIFSVLIGLVLPMLLSAQQASPAEHVLTPSDFSMHRNQMYLDDDQVILFNGRGFVSPRQFSATGITSIHLFPIEWNRYDFWMNFRDVRSGIEVQDNTPELFRNGPDPLGCNFRPGAPMLTVPQEQVWEPGKYERTATFHKNFEGQLVSFSMKTTTAVSSEVNEVLMELEIQNREYAPLELNIEPHQYIDFLKRDERCGVYASHDNWNVTVSTDIEGASEKGFPVRLAPGEKGLYHFALQFTPSSDKRPEIYQKGICNRLEEALQHVRDRVATTSSRLPKIECEYKPLEELYKRCMITVNECIYDRDDFVVRPFLASGTWPISMIWDQCFSEEALAILTPEGVKESIKLVLRLGQAKESYIWYNGTTPFYILYLQDPFAIQSMMDAYITYTGDRSIWDEVIEGKTVYEWMKEWAKVFTSRFTRPDGLIDTGGNTEFLVEIRTDGYDHVVPSINGLAADYYQWLAEEAALRNDKDARKYEKMSQQMIQEISTKLWNDELGWFENLYPDGSRWPTWTYQQFDLLEKDVISPYQKQRMISHIRDGEFLAEYGMYGISKVDQLHWDQVDTDWGGAGQYNGQTLKTACNLFELGYGLMGWEILKRYARYTDHFPYFTHNPLADKMSQDHASMSLQISSGAGMEAIFKGLFGARPQKDGTIVFNPFYHRDMGASRMTDFQFRGQSYDVVLEPLYYEVWKNGKLLAHNTYGTRFVDKAE